MWRINLFEDISVDVVTPFFRAVHSLPLNQGSSGDAFLGALEWQRVRFRKAVRPGDRLRVRMAITSKALGRNGDRGTVNSRWDVLNQNGDAVVELEMVALYRTRNGVAPGSAQTRDGPLRPGESR